MIYKELDRNHFTQKSKDKILLTTDPYENDVFFQEILKLTDNMGIEKIVKKISSDSFLFIDIMNINLNILFTLLENIKKISLSKIFFIFDQPLVPLMNLCHYNDSISQPHNLGKNEKLIVILNSNYSCLAEVIDKYNYKDITLFLPFPSYFPYEREYLLQTTLKGIDSLEATIEINYFDGTVPYDIYYKLLETLGKHQDYLICADKLIASSLVCLFTKNKTYYSYVSMDGNDNLTNGSSKIYEISDLI